jgi:phosphopantothenoylcysteine decarboxylase / phosphopantothenate---cysteine ligase
MAKILVGITGGIAAFKAASLIRKFTESGHFVRVLPTKNALRFIGKATLEALSQNSIEIVDPDLFSELDTVKHINLAKEADVVCIAPATASTIARMASGIADDLLLNVVLATKAPVLLAPAMHTEMWENQATQDNLETLIGRGVSIVEPGFGRLTGDDTGSGRLAEVEEIFTKTISLIENLTLTGKRILVTAGGTREPLDDVRYLGNRSSGKQGIAIARAALNLGAKVQVVAANVDSSLLIGLDVIRVSTAEDLQRALEEDIDEWDVLFMAAAVADFRPKTRSHGKIKKGSMKGNMSVELEQTPDLLEQLVSKNKVSGKVVIGFAAESGLDLEAEGQRKRISKGCDYLIANDVSDGKVFDSDENSVLLLGNDLKEQYSGTKVRVAEQILSELATRL